MVPNEANWAAPTGPTRVAGAVALGAKYAKQTQWGRRPGERQVLGRKGVKTIQTCNEHGKNKANRHGSFKLEGSSVKTGKAVVGTCHLLLRTSDSAEGRSYKQSQLEGRPTPWIWNPSACVGRAFATHRRDGILTWRGTDC